VLAMACLARLSRVLRNQQRLGKDLARLEWKLDNEKRYIDVQADFENRRVEITPHVSGVDPCASSADAPPN